MKLKLSLILITFCCQFLAQEIEWSELEESDGRRTTILPVQGKDFYTAISSRMESGPITLKKYTNFKEVAKNKINDKTPNGRGDIRDYIMNKDKFVAFLSDRNDGKFQLYYQQYNPDCMPSGEPKLITEYNCPKTWNRSSTFRIVQSENKEFFVVRYSIPGKREEHDRFGYVVMNSNFEVTAKGEYESTYSSKDSEFEDDYLSNTGDYYVEMRLFKPGEKSERWNKAVSSKFVVFLISGDEMNEMALSIGNKEITSLSLLVGENRILTITGIYGEGNVTTKGAFYFQVDFNKKDIFNEGYSEFTKEFITQDFSEKEMKKAERKEAKGDGAPELFDYDFREVRTTADGGIIVVMEQNYVSESTIRTANGTSTTKTYYYTDLIVYRVENNGNFEWINKIKKSQVTINDNGFWSSIGGYQSDNSFTMFFNDNTKNYTEQGIFINPVKSSELHEFDKSTKNSCVAKVEIDLKTGKINRERFTASKEEKSLAVPMLFQTDYKNNNMYLYFMTRSKEKFGLLNFKN